MLTQRDLAVPSHVSDKIEIKANSFIVMAQVDPDEYYYYPVRVDMETFKAGKNLVRFLKTPPVLQEGLLCIQKRFFNISIADIQRARFFLSNEVTKDVEPPSSSSANSGNSNNDESGTEQDVILEVSEAADALVEEQTRALLNDQTGEEWAIESDGPTSGGMSF